MALAEFNMYLNDQPASAEQLDLVREVRVDQAIGVAAEAELDIDLTLDDTGVWSGIDEPFAQPFQRVRIEVKLGDDGPFTPLIDGQIVAQRFELGAGPAESTMTLVVHDDSVLLNLTEQVSLFEDMAAHEIAETLITEAGLTAEVEAVAAAGSATTRYVVQRGTAMHLLRDLARRHGMFVYVKPGATPGQSVGVFARPRLTPGAAPELLLLGAERNIHKLSVQYDALQPVAARAATVRISDKAVLTSEADAPDLDPLGDVAVHDSAAAGAVTLLARTREEQNDIDAAAVAAVDLSSFAYTATTEIDAIDYDTVLSPYQVISVAGPGAYLGGQYLISRVHHVINDGSYKQTVTLKRNARSAGTTAGGGLPGGVF
jgi:phage protein D